MSFLKIYIASGNQDKILEISTFFHSINIQFFSSPLPLPKEIETGYTLEENSYLKAKYLYDHGFCPVISDDTGLFLPYLGGIPGIYSSRFAGPSATYEDNRKKLLNTVRFLPFHLRIAYFKTVICYINSEGGVYFFEGKVEGFILDEERGSNLFGYDPIFLYPPLGRTFGELPINLKNSISHRGKALLELKNFLLNQ
ncbi:MAG: RdgB/HAM1 family non-canonical purine NTP pyrophosphatase [Candidatus Hydrothermia bacterium]